MKGDGYFPFWKLHGIQYQYQSRSAEEFARLPREAVESMRVFTLSIGSTGSSSHGLFERPGISTQHDENYISKLCPLHFFLAMASPFGGDKVGGFCA